MIIKHDDTVMLTRDDFRRIACKVLDDEKNDIPEGMATLIQLVIVSEATSTLHNLEKRLFDEGSEEAEGDEE